MAKCPLCKTYPLRKGEDICAMCRLSKDEGTFTSNLLEKNRINEKNNREKVGKIKKTYSKVEEDKEKAKRASSLISSTSHGDAKNFSESNTRIVRRNQNLNEPHSSEADTASFTSEDVENYNRVFFKAPENWDSHYSKKTFNDYQREERNDNENSKTIHTGFGPTPIRGRVRNVSEKQDNNRFLWRWIRGMFTSHIFTFSGQITTFQVYPDNDGDALNANISTSDQVIIYGGVSTGYLSENNVVEVWGSRNFEHAVVARRIRNVSNGTEIRPKGRIPGIVQWFLLTLIAAGIIRIYNSVDWGGVFSSIWSWALSVIVPAVIVIIALRYLWRRLFRRR